MILSTTVASNISGSTLTCSHTSNMKTRKTDCKTLLFKNAFGVKDIKMTFFVLLIIGGFLSFDELHEKYRGTVRGRQASVSLSAEQLQEEAAAVKIPVPEAGHENDSKPKRALFFTSATNETFMVPSGAQYISNWRGPLLGQLHYLRRKEEIVARGKLGNCARTLDVFAWLMDEINTKKSVLMMAYGGLIHLHREKELVDTRTGILIDDDIDLWASLETIVHVGQLEGELFSRFGWSVRAFVNEDTCVVLMQIFASCGHTNGGRKIKSGEPALEVYPLVLVPGSGIRVVRDLWQGIQFPESMVYPTKRIDFKSNGTLFPLHLQLPSKPLDIMGCLYGNWKIPSEEHAGSGYRNCLKYYNKIESAI